MRTVSLVTIFVFSTLAWAEYRAFELVVRYGDGTERTELSNLNPVEYRRFYPVPAGATVGYRATWRCPGNTSWQIPVCPNPREPRP